MNHTIKEYSSVKWEKISVVLMIIHQIERGNMENFILWSVSLDENINQLSFFATSVQIQRINKGTQEMMAKMLKDLGSPKLPLSSGI
jgi:hypothetical protein